MSSRLTTPILDKVNNCGDGGHRAMLLDTARRRVENGDKFHNKQQKPAAPSPVIPSITADSDSALWTLDSE